MSKEEGKNSTVKSMSTVVVVGEVDGSEVKDVSQQVAAVAAGMGDVVGIVMGKNIAEAAMKLSTSKILNPISINSIFALSTLLSFSGKIIFELEESADSIILLI